MFRTRLLILAIVGCAIALAIQFIPALKPRPTLEPVSYGRDIRPILSDRCFHCHGPDGAKRQADLRLDLAESAYAPRQRGVAIVPGDSRRSLLIQRISSDDPKYVMPPPDSNKHALTVGQRELVKRWIDEGARYESHWAFTPPIRPEPPQVDDQRWSANPIDRFVLARMGKEGIEPSPEADGATIARRIYLDLTGLPPTIEETSAFLADRSPGARAALTERLMTTEPYRTRYAERMAVPWLDVARYADTSGIHMDAGRSIWLWRDWVINAFRDNLPYDKFIVEQLAGDLIPGATTAQVIASGFNRNHVTTDEGGAINEEYLLEYAADRVTTTGSAFLGLSLQCARCHDHKFDPVSMQDFYGLIAFFNSNEEPGVYSQVPDAYRSLEPALDVPDAAQTEQLARLTQELEALTAQRDRPSGEEDQELARVREGATQDSAISWERLVPIAAHSKAGATSAIQGDGSILFSGNNEADDDQVISLETDATGLRLLSLEALPDPSLANDRVGRAPNGNAILDSIKVEAISKVDPTKVEDVPLVWAWADIEQSNGDFRIVNALQGGDGREWAVDGHTTQGKRTALFLTQSPVGFEGGTTLRVHLSYHSPYAQHSLGRVRFGAARVSDSTIAKLPDATSAWYIAGPWLTEASEDPYAIARGPESHTSFDPAAKWGEYSWRFAPTVAEAQPVGLAATRGSEFLARQIFAPTAHECELSLGSDDGIEVYLNGALVHQNKVERAVAPDQDRVKLSLRQGENVLVCKIVNGGGPAGFYHRAILPEGGASLAMVPLLLPDDLVRESVRTAARDAWRLGASPRYRQLTEQLALATRGVDELKKAIPHTMVMKEAQMPRETFVLKRGVYDQPDKDRPVVRAIPKALGSLGTDQPANRLGLANWLVSRGNPLTSRVVINRLWSQFFGRGLVRTEDDFGLQGEWPTNPQLLDWLAVEFQESGWDLQHMIRLITQSETYAQSSRVRPDVVGIDPDNRLLSWYPRQRLGAEQIRDQALYVAGLLKEKSGGPSVKPYQPEGLWQEVAMPQSNTRVYERGNGDDLWRRSIYSYWKRAVPPPSLLTFDAPTREFCVTRRMSTNTPLQALVLWNDEQFVEAARATASRILHEATADSDRLARLFASCTGQQPSASTLELLSAALAANRKRYGEAPEDAKLVISIGDSKDPGDIDASELAAWTLLANAVLSSDATIVKD